MMLPAIIPKDLQKYLKKALNEKGGKVVAKEAFLSKDIDFKCSFNQN